MVSQLIRSPLQAQVDMSHQVNMSHHVESKQLNLTCDTGHNGSLTAVGNATGGTFTISSACLANTGTLLGKLRYQIRSHWSKQFIGLIIRVTMVSQFRATRMEAASPFQVLARPTLALLAGDPCQNDQWEASIAKLTDDITELWQGTHGQRGYPSSPHFTLSSSVVSVTKANETSRDTTMQAPSLFLRLVQPIPK